MCQIRKNFVRDSECVKYYLSVHDLTNIIPLNRQSWRQKKDQDESGVANLGMKGQQHNSNHQNWMVNQGKKKKLLNAMFQCKF